MASDREADIAKALEKARAKMPSDPAAIIVPVGTPDPYRDALPKRLGDSQARITRICFREPITIGDDHYEVLPRTMGAGVAYITCVTHEPERHRFRVERWRPTPVEREAAIAAAKKANGNFGAVPPPARPFDDRVYVGEHMVKCHEEGA